MTGIFKHLGVRIVVYAVAFCGLLVVYIKYLERNGIYFPAKDITAYPSKFNLHFEEVYLATPDKLKLNAWYIPCENAKLTLLFCHGNAGNIMDRLDKISLLHKIGLSILIFDYRGFGKSQGSPGEEGIYLDAQAAYDYLVSKRNVASERIVLYGESLGSAVAIDLAKKNKVGGVIIEGGFSSGRDMAEKIYPFLPRFIFSDTFDSISKIKDVHSPLFFMHGREDEIVPFRLAYKLYQEANEPKEFIELSGGHDSSFFNSLPEVTPAISAFLRKL